MLESYKAKLTGDHVVWVDAAPESTVSGETVDIIVTVVAAEPQKGRRPFGLAKGEFVVPDDFDDPLPEDILRDFEGG
jgi:hypothetical protein